MKKEKKMPRTKKNTLPLVINRSKSLDDHMNHQRFTEKTTLGKIEYLNKLRAKNRYYGYGQTIMDKLIEDQYDTSITFNHVVDHQGVPGRPLHFFWDANHRAYMIKYPVNAPESESLIDPNKPVVAYAPNGDNYAIRRIADWLRFEVKNSWGNNEYHSGIVKRLKFQYERAWLDLKRRKVAELKATLDGESVTDYVAQKRAEKTQAIMDIAMGISALNAKLETYRNRIGTVTSASEANQLFMEAENHFRALTYIHNHNVKRLNDRTRIPGGARVKRLAENKE